jgi:hypothetical protein
LAIFTSLPTGNGATRLDAALEAEKLPIATALLPDDERDKLNPRVEAYNQMMTGTSSYLAKRSATQGCWTDSQPASSNASAPSSRATIRRSAVTRYGNLHGVFG